MSEDTLALRLTHYAAWHAAKRGYIFGEGVETELPQRAQRISERIRNAPDVKKNPSLAEVHAKTAEAQLALMVDAMIEAGTRTKGYFADRGAVIGEITYHQANLELCPLWPICD